MFSDNRSKKVALVAHCLLNQNAKVDGYACYKAAVPEFSALLEEFDYGIFQLPCPEMYAAGIRRWWQVSTQYNCLGFKKDFNFLANFTADQITDYLENNFRLVLIGADGSPSCGVSITDYDSKNIWLGKPDIVIQDENNFLCKGEGVFIKCLNEVFKTRNLPFIPRIGFPLDVINSEQNMDTIREFLMEQEKR